jgi:hypothetical protein
MLNNATKVAPAQNLQNAIGLATVVTILHNDETIHHLAESPEVSH